MKTYEATVNLGGWTNKVQVQARDAVQATRIMEAQYGKNNLKSGVYEVR